MRYALRAVLAALALTLLLAAGPSAWARVMRSGQTQAPPQTADPEGGLDAALSAKEDLSHRPGLKVSTKNGKLIIEQVPQDSPDSPALQDSQAPKP